MCVVNADPCRIHRVLYWRTRSLSPKFQFFHTRFNTASGLSQNERIVNSSLSKLLLNLPELTIAFHMRDSTVYSRILNAVSAILGIQIANSKLSRAFILLSLFTSFCSNLLENGIFNALTNLIKILDSEASVII